MFSARRAIGVVLAYAACMYWPFADGAVAGEAQLRSMKYESGTQQQAIVWQKELRSKFVSLLKMDDLISRETDIPLNPKTISSEKKEKYVLHEMEINSTPGRRIQIVLTLPTNTKGLLPAVVCIAGHGGTRHSCYGDGGFRVGSALAERGYVTISTRVAQHEVYEEGRTLMGERLWDLIRCVDFLTSLEEVDSRRIGCAGLSLGGEMAMWLGAMDPRVQAAVSAGFLTKMDQLEKNHCMCWKFPGLRELADFADVYSLTAPRALLCQNGLKERPTWFTVPIAREAIGEIELIYADFQQPKNLSFVAHPLGHAFDAPSLLKFFDEQLALPENPWVN